MGAGVLRHASLCGPHISGLVSIMHPCDHDGKSTIVEQIESQSSRQLREFGLIRYVKGTWTYSVPGPAGQVEQPTSPLRSGHDYQAALAMYPPSFVGSALLFASLTGSAHTLAIAENYAPARPLNKLASLMPQSSLATPAGQLKYVVLGLGTQNYTCAGGDELATPGTTGATGG
jgi:hypothetical protein